MNEEVCSEKVVWRHFCPQAPNPELATLNPRLSILVYTLYTSLGRRNNRSQHWRRGAWVRVGGECKEGSEGKGSEDTELQKLYCREERVGLIFPYLSSSLQDGMGR